MFKFLRESKNDWYDDEVIEGLKNFLFLVGLVAVSGIGMAFVAWWLAQR